MEDILNKYIFPYIYKLIDNDLLLIKRKVHEDAISFRLAHYMINGIEVNDPLLKVDFQYNRNMSNPKNVNNHNRTPDILLHQRESNDYNIIMIEAKKENLLLKDIENINYFLANPYYYKLCIGIEYKPSVDYIKLVSLSKERKIYFKIHKETKIVEIVSDSYRDEYDFVSELFC